MTITAKIISDSISASKCRMTTFVLEFPRFILPELATHRVFSKNTASSRAIPVEKMIQKVLTDPAIPVSWGKNQKGMSASEDLSPQEQIEAKEKWLKARDSAVKSAQALNKLGLHKQIVNRTIENFMNVKVILTGTEFDNFFNLRCHSDAQPEIQVLAKEMKYAIDNNCPIIRNIDSFSTWDNFHLPFVSDEELLDRSESNMFKNLIHSVARSARVSYDKVEGGLSSFDNDLRVFKQLGESSPRHASPFEHIGLVEDNDNFYYNLRGWSSLRFQIENKVGLFEGIIDKAKA